MVRGEVKNRVSRAWRRSGEVWAVREGPAGESRAFHAPDQKPLTVRVLPMAAAVTETVPWTLDTFRPAMAFTAAPLAW